MSLSISAPTVFEYFRSLVESDEHFLLFETAVSIAQDEYPELDVQQVLGDVDQLLARVQRRVPGHADALRRLRVLNQFFFDELGFGGNLNDYYDPDNSYLNALLRTRRGIPISLGVLWLELAHGLGIHARGVAFPGHFMLKVSLPEGQVIMDPFNGHPLTLEEIAERLEPYRFGDARIGDSDTPMGLYLQSATPREIIARMLRNLKEIHHAQEDWRRAIAVQDRLVLLLPDAWSEYRDRGLAHARQGSVDLALRDLETYLAHARLAPDQRLIAERCAALRRI